MPVTVVSSNVVDYDQSGKPYIFKNPYNYYGTRRRYKCRAQQVEPRLDLIKEGEAVALDIEGVILDDEISIGKAGVGRLSLTGEHGQVVFDAFPYYPPNVKHRPPPQWLKLGVKYNDIKPCYGARPIEEVLANAEKVIKKAGAVIFHAIENEIHYVTPRTLKTTDGDFINTFGFDLTQFKTHDTQMFEEYRRFATGRQRKPRLDILAQELLDRNIRTTEHSSVEDARATMELFLRRREEFGTCGSWSPSNTAISDSMDDIAPMDGRSDATAVDIIERAQDFSVALIASTMVVEGKSFADAASGRRIIAKPISHKESTA